MIKNLKKIDDFNYYEITFDNGVVSKAHLVGTHLDKSPERYGTIGILRFDFDDDIIENKLKEPKDK